MPKPDKPHTEGPLISKNRSGLKRLVYKAQATNFQKRDVKMAKRLQELVKKMHTTPK